MASSIDPRHLVTASWIGTGVFTITAALAVFIEAIRPVSLVTALVWFGLGVAAFVTAFLIGVQRSRTENVTVPGLFLLSGSVPSTVRWSLLASALAQTVVAVVTASVRPFSSLAFGILVPMYGLGVAGLYAALHGTFEPRPTR